MIGAEGKITDFRVYMWGNLGKIHRLLDGFEHIKSYFWKVWCWFSDEYLKTKQIRNIVTVNCGE